MGGTGDCQACPTKPNGLCPGWGASQSCRGLQASLDWAHQGARTHGFPTAAEGHVGWEGAEQKDFPGQGPLP